MVSIDENEVKRVSAAFDAQRLRPPLAPPSSKSLKKNLADVEKIFTSYFAKTGLPIDKLNKLAAKSKAERRKLIDGRGDESAKASRAAEAAFHQGMAYRRQALQLLSTPFQSTLITLDKPFLIWELPHPESNVWIDSNVESLNSSIKFEIITRSGADATTFLFYFLWTNDSDFAAVVNVNSSLVLNGVCQVLADSGILQGHHNYITLSANLILMRWSGWGTDPVTGASNDQTLFPFPQQTQFQTVAQLDQYGGDWFDDPSGNNEQSFNFQPFSLSCDLIAIPARATTLFEVSILASYTIQDGDDFDYVAIDFAQDKFARRVLCPSVELELLTQAPMAMAG